VFKGQRPLSLSAESEILMF